MDNDRDLRRNGSGYFDPTAYQAIKNVMNKNMDEDLERFHKLLRAIFNICELSDFYLEERLVVRDKRTGKIWR
jgi:hypothetical protein